MAEDKNRVWTQGRQAQHVDTTLSSVCEMDSSKQGHGAIVQGKAAHSSK